MDFAFLLSVASEALNRRLGQAFATGDGGKQLHRIATDLDRLAGEMRAAGHSSLAATVDLLAQDVRSAGLNAGNHASVELRILDTH